MVDLAGRPVGGRKDGARLSGLVSRVRAWTRDRSDVAVAQRFASIAYLFRVGNAGIAFVSQILLARWMGSHEFGIYIYVWTWVNLLGTLTNVGLASTPQRFIPEYTEKGEMDLLRGFVVGSRWLAFGIASAFAAAGATALFFFGDMLSTWAVIPLYLGLVCLPLYVLTEVQEGLARVYDWPDLAMAPAYLVRPLLLIFGLAVMHVFDDKADAVDAMLAAVASTWITSLLQMIILDRRLKKRVPAGPRHFKPMLWLSVSFPIFLVEGFYFLLTYTDILVLERFVSPEQVAIYYAATKLVAIVAFIYFAVAAAAAHRFTEYHVTGNIAELNRFVRSSIRWTFIPSVFAALAIVASGKFLLWLFGPEFTAGYSLLPVLVIGLLARASIGPVEKLLNMLGHQGVCAWIYAGAFVINLTLNFILIPHFGLMGAATATTTALIVESILLFLAAKYRLGLHVFYWGGPPAIAQASPS